MLTRRRILAGTLSCCVGGTVGAGLVPPLAAAAAEGVAEAERAAVLRLSRRLTGFEALSEALAGHYAAFLARRDPAGWRALVDGFAAAERAAQEALPPALAGSETAARLTRLWYSGWTEPAPEVPAAVRAEGYREALAWRALGLTPRGLPTGRLWQDGLE